MNLQDIAEYVYNGYVTKSEIDPVIEKYPEITVEQAYQIQLLNVDKQVMKDSVVGKKIGLTSKVMQDKLGINQPDFGHLFVSREVKEESVSISDFAFPKIEAEIAFVLKSDLEGENISQQDIIDATDYVVGAFEIADSRIKDWNFSLEDTVCDNAAFGSYKLGSVKLDINDIDLVNESVVMEINDVEVNEGSGAACLGSPLNCMEWLVKELSKNGLGLKAGDIILTGALSGATPVKENDKIRIEFTNLGVVEIEFTK